MTGSCEPPPAAGTSTRPVVAVVDCDETLRTALVRLLEARDLCVVAYPTSRAFLQACSDPDADWPVADLLLCRLELESHGGLAFLRHLKRWELEVPVVVYSTGGDISSAVGSFHAGALDFIDHAKADACFRQRVLSSLERAASSPARRRPSPRRLLSLPSTH